MGLKFTNAQLMFEVEGKLREIYADFDVPTKQMTEALACIAGVAMKEEGRYRIDNEEVMIIVEAY